MAYTVPVAFSHNFPETNQHTTPRQAARDWLWSVTRAEERSVRSTGDELNSPAGWLSRLGQSACARPQLHHPPPPLRSVAEVVADLEDVVLVREVVLPQALLRPELAL